MNRIKIASLEDLSDIFKEEERLEMIKQALKNALKDSKHPRIIEIAKKQWQADGLCEVGNDFQECFESQGFWVTAKVFVSQEEFQKNKGNLPF